MRNKIHNILFRIKWLTMSERRRYAYLWDTQRVKFMNLSNITYVGSTKLLNQTVLTGHWKWHLNESKL